MVFVQLVEYGYEAERTANAKSVSFTGLGFFFSVHALPKYLPDVSVF